MNRSLLNLIALGSLLLPAFAACGDDDDDTSAGRPAGPPSIRIGGFIGADNRVVERSDENALDVCEDRLGVVVEIPENTWTLRPPGRCAGTPQCGYVNVSLDPDGDSALISTNSLNLTTMLDLTGRPVLESAGGATGEGGGGPIGALVSEGSHRVRVELRNADGSRFLDASGEPVADEAEVELTFVPCATSGAGGGGQGGAPGAGGSTSGAGGSGEAGAAGAGDAGGQGGAGLGGEGGAGFGGEGGAGLGGAG